MKKLKQITESPPELKLVYTSKKKLVIREMGCKRAQSKDWNFNGIF